MQLRTSFQKIYTDEAQHIDLFFFLKMQCSAGKMYQTGATDQARHATERLAFPEGQCLMQTAKTSQQIQERDQSDDSMAKLHQLQRNKRTPQFHHVPGTTQDQDNPSARHHSRTRNDLRLCLNEVEQFWLNEGIPHKTRQVVYERRKGYQGDYCIYFVLLLS